MPERLPKGLRESILAILQEFYEEKSAINCLKEYEEIIRMYLLENYEVQLLHIGLFCENVILMLKSLLYKSLDEKEVKRFQVELGKLSEFLHAQKQQICSSLGIPPELVERLLYLVLPALRLLYNLRSKQRGPHEKPITPERQDAELALVLSKWILAELVRLAGSQRKNVEEVTMALLRRHLPIIEWIRGSPVPLKRIGAKKEILLVIYAMARPVTRAEIGKLLGEYYKPPTLTNAIKELNRDRFIREVEPKVYQITTKGERMVEEIYLEEV